MTDRNNERGIALVLALFLISTLSVLGASLMFLAQTETYASMNYRMMSQTRYGAEAGVQKASNFLLDPAQYAAPTAADLLNPALCNRNVSPVTCNGAEVVLSASLAKTSNYPVPAVQAAFNLAGQGTVPAGNATLTYHTYARLMALQVFDSYGGGGPGSGISTTWEITSDGGLVGSPKATVEILALIETPKVPASTYGAFGTDDQCGALTFGGNVTINSYDSSGMVGSTTPAFSSTGGDVGTNGNLDISGSVDVQGNLYTPRTGVGKCTAGAVDGLTEGGHAQVDGSMVQLPGAVSYPTPVLPGPSGVSAASISSGSTTAATCAALGLAPAATLADVMTKPGTQGTNQCFVTPGASGSADVITVSGHGAALSLPSVTLSSQVNLVIQASSPAAQVNFNSIVLTGGASVGITATSPNEGALLGIIGKNPDGTSIASPVDFRGGTYAGVTGCATCSQYDASMMQMLYAGTGEIQMTGNNAASLTVYAPNALFTLSGTADVYGSVLAHRLNETGTGNIHYDRRLRHDFYVLGRPIMGTFNWKRFQT
jgi:Tfp pilus assembly protein PilX